MPYVASRLCFKDYTNAIQIAETATPGSSTPKPETNGQQDGEGDHAMDEDEPGAVDARSIYIGNVRTHLLQWIPSAPNYQHLWMSMTSRRSTPMDCGASAQ